MDSNNTKKSQDRLLECEICWPMLRRISEESNIYQNLFPMHKLESYCERG